ncbi:MAG: class I SAM-dependent methyltransferase [Flavobacteriales bacterium]|nr:class I SAM-dependent methyltransferase [Flavobacteriales bacterium]
MNCFDHFLNEKDNILDLGCGNCTIANELINRNYQLQPLDIKNQSIVPNIQPMIYDGETIPFRDSSFDVVLLLTVLHHTSDPIETLRESIRVGGRIIIIEDTYRNFFLKILTQFVDTIVNLGFSKMTYQNRSEAQWEDIFEQLNLTILNKQTKSVLFIFQQTVYHLKNT